MQARLNKSTVNLLKIATKITFVRYLSSVDGSQVVTALIHIDDAFPQIAHTDSGWGDFWDAHDIEKSIRSIRRHNKQCVILDRRDFVWSNVSDLHNL